MAQTPNFRKLLQQTSAEVERPKVFPKGHYRGRFLKHEFGLSKEKQTPFVQFWITPTSAMDDVDQELLHGIEFTQDKKFSQKFYITPKALYRLSDMLDRVLGPDEEKWFDERVPDTDGMDCVFSLNVNDSNDGSGDQYNTIGVIMSAQDVESNEDEAEAA